MVSREFVLKVVAVSTICFGVFGLTQVVLLLAVRLLGREYLRLDLSGIAFDKLFEDFFVLAFYSALTIGGVGWLRKTRWGFRVLLVVFSFFLLGIVQFLFALMAWEVLTTSERWRPLVTFFIGCAGITSLLWTKPELEPWIRSRSDGDARPENVHRNEIHNRE